MNLWILRNPQKLAPTRFNDSTIITNAWRWNPDLPRCFLLRGKRQPFLQKSPLLHTPGVWILWWESITGISINLRVGEEEATKLSTSPKTNLGNPSPCLPYRSPSGLDSPQTSGPLIAVQPLWPQGWVLDDSKKEGDFKLDYRNHG